MLVKPKRDKASVMTEGYLTEQVDALNGEVFKEYAQRHGYQSKQDWYNRFKSGLLQLDYGSLDDKIKAQVLRVAQRASDAHELPAISEDAPNWLVRIGSSWVTTVILVITTLLLSLLLYKG
jgi:hypothetical protein